jgi:hypothetical protein
LIATIISGSAMGQANVPTTHSLNAGGQPHSQKIVKYGNGTITLSTTTLTNGNKVSSLYYHNQALWQNGSAFQVVDMPDYYIVNDLEIMGDTLYFCGKQVPAPRKITDPVPTDPCANINGYPTGFVGYVKIAELFSGNNVSTHYNYAVSELTKLRVYIHDGVRNIAAMGYKIMPSHQVQIAPCLSLPGEPPCNPQYACMPEYQVDCMIFLKITETATNANNNMKIFNSPYANTREKFQDFDVALGIFQNGVETTSGWINLVTLWYNNGNNPNNPSEAHIYAPDGTELSPKMYFRNFRKSDYTQFNTSIDIKAL